MAAVAAIYLCPRRSRTSHYVPLLVYTRQLRGLPGSNAPLLTPYTDILPNIQPALYHLQPTTIPRTRHEATSSLLCLHATFCAPPPLMSAPTSTVSSTIQSRPLQPHAHYTLPIYDAHRLLYPRRLRPCSCSAHRDPFLVCYGYHRQVRPPPLDMHAGAHPIRPMVSQCNPSTSPSIDTYIPDSPPKADVHHACHVQPARHAFLVLHVAPSPPP
ncbi:hypothetical protein B0H14DRAFT_3423343 [Mycena olivaceomarginata]|nr:hypothetical protein B0H14DRAFT_3423343 [Mycena olivaceomarginata]